MTPEAISGIDRVIVDATAFTNNLDRFLATREGLMSLAYASEDAGLAAEDLRGRGAR